MPAWKKNLYALFVAELLSVAGFQVIVPFLPLYVDELKPSFGSVEFWAGLVYSAHALTTTVVSPFWGALADRLGRKVMVQRAMFSGAVMLSLMAFSRSVEQLVLLRAMQGLVTGIVPAANALVAASVPRQRTGYAMGMMQMSYWLGTSAGPLIGGVIADTLGFHAAFHLTGFLLFLGGVGVTFFVQEEFVPDPDGGARQRMTLRDWSSLLRRPLLIEILSMRFLIRLAQSLWLPFLPLFVATLVVSQRGVSTAAGLAAGATSLCAALSSVYLGSLGDRIGYERCLFFFSLVAAVGYGTMALITREWQLLVLSVCVGAALGSLIPALAALLSHVAPARRTGSVYGLDSSVTSVGRMVAPMLGALIITQMGLRAIFLMITLIFLLIAVVATTLRPGMRIIDS